MARLMPLVLLSLLALGGCATLRADKALVDSLDREVIALQTRNEVLEQRLAACATDDKVPEVYIQLQQVFAGGEVVVERHGFDTHVVVPTSLLLDARGASVRVEAGMVLDLVSTAISLHPELQVVVVGHTDDAQPTGAAARQWPSNFEQSAAQAGVVARALRDRYHVDAARLTVAGRGGVEPLVDNATPEGRAKNRRVVIVLTPGGVASTAPARNQEAGP